MQRAWTPLRLASPRLALLSLLGGCVLLSGCIGSSETYKPGYQPRPKKVTAESETARAKRTAVPVRIYREDARWKAGRREVARIMGTIPKSPWTKHEWDLEDALGRPAVREVMGRTDTDPDAQKALDTYHAARRPKRPEEIEAEKARPRKKAKADEGEEDDEEGGDEEGGDEEEGDEEEEE